jgi:putative multicomponent Na+:H+ antiporter subunit B
MTEDLSILAIAALLPLTACLLVSQVNPYHALVIRGILGAVAALVYALFGAADVALTEALVGTMLSITLYAIAVRSSLSMRLGVLENEANAENSEQAHPSEELFSALRQTFSKYQMRLELVAYSNPQALQTALMAKEIHTTYVLSEQWVVRESTLPSPPGGQSLYLIQTRVQRLYDIMQAELPPTLLNLTALNLVSLSQPDANQSGMGIGPAEPVEGQS